MRVGPSAAARPQDDRWWTSWNDRPPSALGRIERGALFGHLVALGEVLLHVEKDLAVDEGRFGARVDAERMRVPDHDVGVLADLDRSDAILHAELHGAVVGDRFQRV